MSEHEFHPRRHADFRAFPVRTVRHRIAAFRRRSAVAAVELALTVPVIVAIIFGSMEIANGLFLHQSIKHAAYQAAKVISKPNVNEELARTRCGEVLGIRDVTDYKISYRPEVTEDTSRGTPIRVTVTASPKNLAFGPIQFFKGRSFSATVVMAKL